MPVMLVMPFLTAIGIIRMANVALLVTKVIQMSNPLAHRFVLPFQRAPIVPQKSVFGVKMNRGALIKMHTLQVFHMGNAGNGQQCNPNVELPQQVVANVNITRHAINVEMIQRVVGVMMVQILELEFVSQVEIVGHMMKWNAQIIVGILHNAQVVNAMVIVHAPMERSVCSLVVT